MCSTVGIRPQKIRDAGLKNLVWFFIEVWIIQGKRASPANLVLMIGDCNYLQLSRFSIDLVQPGRPAFTVEQQEGAMNVVMDTANKIGVR